MPKFLIIRFSSIGDIVLTSPVTRCLHNQVKDAELHYVTKAAFKPILENNPHVHRIHLLENDISKTTALLKKEHFDFVIDLHHNLRSLRVKRALGVKSFSFPKLNIEKWLITGLKWDRLPDLHIVDRYLQTVQSFGVINDGRGLDYFLSMADQVPDSEIPPYFRNGFIGLVIGAAHATKRLPLRRLRELCQQIAYPVLLLGGPEDRETGEVIAADNPQRIWNACGLFSINQSADLVRRSRMVISHDTGLMHIAAAYKKPLISIWGNTIPRFGMYPYYGDEMVKNELFEVNDLPCRPCSKIGYERCPKAHFKCMEEIDLVAISGLANRWYESSN